MKISYWKTVIPPSSLQRGEIFEGKGLNHKNSGLVAARWVGGGGERWDGLGGGEGMGLMGEGEGG